MNGLKAIRSLIGVIAGVVLIFLVLSGKLNDTAARLFAVFSNNPEIAAVMGGEKSEDVEEEEKKEETAKEDVISPQEEDGTKEEIENETKAKTEIKIDYNQVYDYAFGSVNTDMEYGTYYLWDIDGNGIYELILGHGEFTADYINDIWTVGDDGGILGIGTIGGECEFYVAPDYQGIYAVYAHMGHESISRITLVNGKLVEEVISEREIGEDEDYYSSEMVIASADITDRSLLTRISSITGAESEAQPLTYGTYVYDDGSSMICTAEVGFATGDGMDYISIDCRGYGGHGIIEFLGYLEQNPDGSYTAVCTDYEAVLICTFDEQGMSVEVDSTEFDTLYDVEGYYGLESALDLSNVG